MTRLCFPLPEVLDAGTCARLIAEATQRGFAATGRDYPPSYRNNDRRVHDDPALAAWLFERVRAQLPPRLEREGQAWELVGLNERFRFCRYQGGQGFRIHRDGAHAPTPDQRSWLTFQIYLDDASTFEGGRTRFYASRRGPLTHAVVPRAGHAIVFDHQYWHDGEPVPAGTKHVLRTDVLYRRTTTVDGHTGYVYAVLPLADGRVASASRDRTIRLWDGPTCVGVLAGHGASVTCLSQAAPGTLLSGSRDHTVRRWDLVTGTSEVVARFDAAVLSLSPTQAGCGDGGVYDLADGRRTRQHAGWVWALAGPWSGCEDGTLVGPSGSRAPAHGPIHALALGPDGRLAAGFADGTIVVGERTFQAHDGEVYALAWIDESTLASGGEDDQAKVWAVSEGRCLAELPHDDFVRAVARLGANTLVTGSYDGRVRTWRWR